MHWKSICLLIFLSAIEAAGQVVNVEQARVNADSVGWQTSLDVSYFRQQFDDDLTTLTGRFATQRKTGRMYVLLLLDGGYSRSTAEVYTNYKMAHLRGSIKVNPAIRWEGFLQVQDNPPLGIALRQLVGTGPRIRILMHEKSRLYGGTTVMLENEWAVDGVVDAGVFRSSNYLNFNWSNEEKWGIASTVYIQPRLTDFGDYRISGQHSLVYSLSKRLQLKAEYTHYFDRKPPSIGLNRSRVTSLGLSYLFE